MLSTENKNYLHYIHTQMLEQLQKDYQDSGVCRPLFLYALDETIFPDKARMLIEEHLKEILEKGEEFKRARKRQENAPVAFLKQFPLALILFHILQFYRNSNGGETWKCIRPGVSAASTFGLILDNARCLSPRKRDLFLPEITAEYGITRGRNRQGLLLNDDILRALHCHDAQWNNEECSYNYTEWFRYHCPFLAAEEQGETAGRLKANKRIFNLYLADSFLFRDTWAELCERADSGLLAQECRNLAQDIISRECDDNPPKYEDGHLHPIITDSSYIHALLQYVPMEYFLSIKALCSDEQDEEIDHIQRRWPWMKALWGKTIERFHVSFTWQLYQEDKHHLAFILHSSLEKSVLLCQKGTKHVFYRPQIIAADLERYGFNLFDKIDIYETNGIRLLGSAEPLPFSAAYLLPEHPGQAKTGRDVCESERQRPALYRRRLYLISRGEIASLCNSQGMAMTAQTFRPCLKDYNVQLFLLNAPLSSATTELRWKDKSLYIHMPARPEIPDSNGYDNIEVCRIEGARKPYCIQQITAEAIDEALDSHNTEALISLLSADENDRLGFMSYTARLENGDGTALISLTSTCCDEETGREFLTWGHQYNIIPRDDGYLIEKLVDRKKSPERYFISRVLPNYVTVTCNLRFGGHTSLDRSQDCLILPPEWKTHFSHPADVQQRYSAARRLNDCRRMKIGNHEVTIELPMKEQACFILKGLLHPTVGCADNTTGALNDLSLHIFPDNNSATALGILTLPFTLRHNGHSECVQPYPGETLQELFCRSNVPFMASCELRHGGDVLFSGLFVPAACCATKESIFLPAKNSETYTLKLLHESGEDCSQRVSADTLHQCGVLLLSVGCSIGISDIIATFFPGSAEQAGWHRLVIQFTDGTEMTTPCFYRGGDRIIAHRLIRGFNRHREEYERDWPELAAEIRTLTTSEESVENAFTGSEPTGCKHYPLHDSFVSALKTHGFGYIDCEGKFTQIPGRQIPLRRFFRIEGDDDAIVSPKYNKDGTYTYTRAHRRYPHDEYSVQRDFSFANNTYNSWYEKSITGEETLYPMTERWLEAAEHELPQLCYRDMKELGTAWVRGATWLEYANTDIFDGGYSLVFQIAKRLLAQEQHAKASLLLLSLRNVMRNRGVKLENQILEKRLELLENTISKEEETMVARCMNLIHWLLIHF